MFNKFTKSIKNGAQVYPEMVTIVIDRVVIEGKLLFSVSYMLHIDEDLHNGRRIELGTTLYSETSLDDAALIAIVAAEYIWSLDILYPVAVVRDENVEVKGIHELKELIVEYQKNLYKEEETV